MSDGLRVLQRIVWLAAILAVVSSGARAGSRVLVLTNDSQMRVFRVMKTPVVMGKDGKFKTPLLYFSRGRTKPMDQFESPMAAADWRGLKFDDGSWLEARAPIEALRGKSMHQATKNAMICSRSYFKVIDPAGVKDLKLSLEYVGGAAVFVNGVEVTRKNLPKGELKADALADKYPDDLYVEPGNKFLQFAADNPKGFEGRYRKLEASIPNKLLKKGVNVLALQLHRAPANEEATKLKFAQFGGMRRQWKLWAGVGLSQVELSAAAGSSVEANVGRPAGIQVWSCEITDNVTAFAYANPAAPERPITIPAARNGTFVGRFVISSGSDIDGLKASIPELVHADGKSRLSGKNVELRHARPVEQGESWLPAHRFDGLLAGVPASATVRKLKIPAEKDVGFSGGRWVRSGASPLAYSPKGRSVRRLTRACAKSGAAVPLWLTVKVPADAKPGKYTGSVKVSAQGMPEKKLPVELEVVAWTLPAPRDFRMKHTNTFSPDSLAIYYKVPYWSDKHMELMGKSMKLMADVGARQVIVHMARYTQSRDEFNCMDSIVRWKKKNGGYEYDFTALEKYLDLVEKTMGSPRPLRINCWTEARKKPGKWDRRCPVSQLDPATGKVGELDQPVPGSEESVKFWKPVLGELRKRIEKRGWWDVTTVGHSSYAWSPIPDLVELIAKIWPDARWSYTAHNGTLGMNLKGKGKSMPVGVSVCVWTEGKLTPRGYRALLKPGREKLIWNSVCRNRHVDVLAAKWPHRSTVRCIYRLPEEVLLRGHDGLGYLSSELFPLENPKRKGRYYRVTINAGGVAGSSTKALLAPGKDGPIPTERYEAFRQSVQECEAIIYLQKALETKAIDGELAKKVDGYLQVRGEAFIKGISAGSAGNRKLLSLAAEVAKVAGK